MAQWDKLKQLREGAGMSRAELAKASGVSEPQICRMEKGVRDWKKAEYATIEALADALGVSFADLTDESAADDMLQRIERLNRRDRALLKDGAGKPVSDASARTMRVFYQVLPAAAEIDDDESTGMWYQAACIPAAGLSREPLSGPVIPLPEALHRIAHSDGIGRIEDNYLIKRAEHALDAWWGSDAAAAQLLYKLVRIAVQEGYRIDYRQLIHDILRWNDENHPVAREWVPYLTGEQSKKGQTAE